jgi:ubiquinone/menaquinone biosynthesis C-methylase UbiE
MCQVKFAGLTVTLIFGKNNMKDFTHVSNYPQYMKIVEQFVISNGKLGQSHLDMPAGNGLLAENLIKAGFNSVCGDFNSEKPNYIYVNMEEKLPFDDNSFNFITSFYFFLIFSRWIVFFIFTGSYR